MNRYNLKIPLQKIKRIAAYGFKPIPFLLLLTRSSSALKKPKPHPGGTPLASRHNLLSPHHIRCVSPSVASSKSSKNT